MAPAGAPSVDEVIVSDSEDDLPPVNDEPPYPYFVLKQDVEIEVNFRSKRIQGKSHITLGLVSGAISQLDELAIDARQSEIDVKNITITALKDQTPISAPRKVPATYTDPYKLLDYPDYYNWNASHHDLRKIRMRSIMHNRRHDVPAENRELVGCTPVDGALRINLREAKKMKETKEGKEEPTSGAGVAKRPLLKIRVWSVTPNELQASELASSREIRVTIPFKTKLVRDGFQFVGVDPGDLRYPHAYTRHSIEPGTASCIFPCIDDPGQLPTWTMAVKCPRTLGDALWQPLATQRANGNANNHRDRGQANQSKTDRDFALTEEDKLLEMTVVCSGSLSDEIVDPEDERKKIMTFDLDKRVAVQKIGFAVGPFEHVDLFSDFRTEENDEKLGGSALKIHGYCLPGRATEVHNTCAALAAAADFFTLTFARFPFESYKLCFLDDMADDTVALQSLSFISTRLLFPEDMIDPEVDVTRQLVYSLASQWSGINLFPNTRRDLWVVIGIAYYMTDLFLKKLCGNNDYRFRMKTMSDKLVTVDVKRPSLHELGHLLHIGDFEMEFMALKAPLVLFILDKRLMKAPAQTNLTRIISRILYKANIGEKQSEWIINTESFQRVCEKNARNKLEAFWAQWVYGSGCPRFDVFQRFNKKRLCVEMTIRQVQDRALSESEVLKKTEFFRAIKEKANGVQVDEAMGLFTGPMTIRIHEADGTPYEHIVEIREDAAKTAKFEIPYNTKYKRLKRKRRATEKLSAQSAADPDNNEETLLYCLGDVLTNPEDMRKWEFSEWEPEIEKAMDQESYEWIRMDADFEWACEMKTNLQSYMYVSQLQQDRDVVAQQDSMLYLRKSPPHPLVSTFLTRTLVDRRYFHGIRTMAADMLYHHATEKVAMAGMTHLLKAFTELFCYPNTATPRPNDFTDKKQYLVQSALPMAIAKIRDANGRCPEPARRLLLNQVQFNNNVNNPYSDHFYVAKLLEAVAHSLIPEKRRDAGDSMDLDTSIEERSFLGEAIVEIDRFRRMDEWANSYQNIWTTTALECRRKLMKAGVIPRSALDFIQYLQDDTCDLVRLKAFEALVDLGYMMELSIFRLIVSVMSTDRSPFVRDKLLKIFCTGLASLAFGEQSRARAAPLAADSGELTVINNTEGETQERRKQFARKQDINVALAALRAEMEEQYAEQERPMMRAVWRALDSKVIGRAEKITLIELCGAMFDAADRWTITMKYPKRWAVNRPVQRQPGRNMINFKSYFKTGIPQKPKEKEPELLAPAPLPAPVPAAVTATATATAAATATASAPARPTEPKRLIVSMKSGTAKANKPASPAPRPFSAAPRPSPSPAMQSPVPSAAPSPVPREADSIVAQSITKSSTPKPSVAKPSVAKPSVAKPSVAKPSPSVPKLPTAKPTTTKPSVAKPGLARPGVAKPVVSSPSLQQNGRSTPQATPEPSGTGTNNKLQKRPRPDKVPGVDDASPVLKKPKLSIRPDGTVVKKRRMFRFKHPNLRQILKKAGVKNMGPVRDPSQLKNRKPGHSLSARASPAGSPAPLPSESINAKPARKPLPGGPSTASPSPGPASLPPKPPPQASPPPAEGQAPKKVKLVIKKPSSSLPK
ncbi:Transcription initiation factor TFIID subunit 2 [Colletotrichum shisoi]|uniref:Transcription initiation factor TFIID subunit 2 n=1 Tax=Colletotrichum shisoi TaxID=2078593 RepID=A0A5Q4BJD8_9PEZI|nr:Transcription initiation factor TFIID subunit 2 [Colletotrichum shisoi]